MRLKTTTFALIVGTYCTCNIFSQSPERSIPPVRSVIDPGVITTRQSITPAGVQSIFEGRVFGVGFGSDSNTLYAATASRSGASVYQLDWKCNKVIEVFASPATPGMQSVAFDPVRRSILLSAIAGGKKGKKAPPSVQLWETSAGHGVMSLMADKLGSDAVGGVAISPSATGSPRYAVVPLTFNDAASIVNLSDGSVHATVSTGIAPFGAIINSAGTAAYVSNWGGRFPRPNDKVAIMGLNPSDADRSKEADRVVVDERGIVSNGLVSRINLVSGTVTAAIPVGLHPTALAWDEATNRLYVTNSNSDTVSVIDTVSNRVADTIAIQPFGRKIAGISPESLVLSKDGHQLYVACSGINAIAVLSVHGGRNRVTGLIPTGWYPDHIALSPDGHYLAVATLLGVGSGWRDAPENRFKGTDLRPGPTRRYVHSYRGTVQVVAIPDATQLAQYTTAVAEDNHLPLSATYGDSANTTTALSPIPSKTGNPSPIQHIVYIIKENRSYDQYFGSIPTGNGDPTLENYGDDVIPNHRALAQEFVLLDNFYANGGNSGDGHQWVTQATETDYTYWPGYGGRSYPKNGDDPMAFANSGFLWSNVLAHKKSFQDFGEYAGFIIPATKLMDRIKLLDDYKNGDDFSGRFQTKAPIAALDPYVARDFPGYGLQVPDVVRARIFLEHLKTWQASGNMPNLVMVQLPSDHTSGTTPGFSTPKACLADNDLAVGKIVEGISHSKFWKSALILVVEDDAQDGLDHVDGHRTVALAVSPYIKRHSTDSTFYSQVSMIKTIENILGLPNLSLFDLIANNMSNSFTDQPAFEPYTAIVPKQSIYETNPALDSLTGQARRDAIASAHMNWLVPDAAPTGRLNAILWRNARAGAPAPGTKNAVFSLYADPSAKDDDKQ